MVTAIVVLGFLMLLCLLGLVKNEITYKIEMLWIDEVYADLTGKTNNGLTLEDLPSYYKVFWDVLLWKYKPLSEYLNK